MVSKKDSNYRDYAPKIVLEVPLSQGEEFNGIKSPDIPAQAILAIHRMTIDAPDRRDMFEALGYIPYSGGNTSMGKTTRVIREPQWKIARKVLDNHGS